MGHYDTWNEYLIDQILNKMEREGIELDGNYSKQKQTRLSVINIQT